MAADHAIRTTCAYCGVGCGLLVTPDARGGANVAGDPEHPANLGREAAGCLVAHLLVQRPWRGARGKNSCVCLLGRSWRIVSVS